MNHLKFVKTCFISTLNIFPFIILILNLKLIPTLGCCSLRSNRGAPLSCLISSEFQKRINYLSFWFSRYFQLVTIWKFSWMILSTWRIMRKTGKLLLVLWKFGKWDEICFVTCFLGYIVWWRTREVRWDTRLFKKESRKKWITIFCFPLLFLKRHEFLMIAHYLKEKLNAINVMLIALVHFSAFAVLVLTSVPRPGSLTLMRLRCHALHESPIDRLHAKLIEGESITFDPDPWRSMIYHPRNLFCARFILQDLLLSLSLCFSMSWEKTIGFCRLIVASNKIRWSISLDLKSSEDQWEVYALRKMFL